MGDASAMAGFRGEAVVMLMSRRSREAFALAKSLWTHWDLRPGGVEVRWTDGWFGDRYRHGWEIAWDDGPTIKQMRQVARKVPAGPAIGALVHQDLVRYQRSLTLTGWAVSLVRQVRASKPIPQLADPRVEEVWRERLERTEFPERARSAEEQALAEVLLRRGLHDYRRVVAAADQAWVKQRRRVPAPPMPEVLMAQALATFGLDALVALEQAGNVVELPHPGLDRDEGLDLP